MDVKMHESWKQLLEQEFETAYFRNLVDFVKTAYKEEVVYPKASAIFRSLNDCPFSEVKVVILGQDPYHTEGMADGLCFSVQSDVKKLPPSLKNIFKELQDDLGVEKKNGDLSQWAKQGVLLLNTVLTVRKGVADSHAGKGWEQFTDAIIHAVNQHKKNVVYILWGSKAIAKARNLNRDENLIITAPHPSPLSSYRGFFGSKPFSKTNEYLRSFSKEEIDW